MLERYLAPVFLSFAKKYIQNLPDLQLSLWGGDVVLNNLDLRRNAIEDELQLPVHILQGFIQELKVHVPWTSLSSLPVEITINSLDLVLCRRKAPPTRTSPDTAEDSGGFLASLIAKIKHNVVVRINNLRVVYQSENFELHIESSSLSCYTANTQWQRSFVDPAQHPSLRRIVVVQDLSLSLSSPTFSGNDGSFSIDIEHILTQQASLEVRIYIPADQPRRFIDVDIQQLLLALSDTQYIQLWKLASELASGLELASAEPMPPLERATSPKLEASSPRGTSSAPSLLRNKRRGGWLSWAWDAITDDGETADRENVDVDNNTAAIVPPVLGPRTTAFTLFIAQAHLLLKATQPLCPLPTAVNDPNFAELQTICSIEATALGLRIEQRSDGVGGVDITVGLQSAIVNCEGAGSLARLDRPSGNSGQSETAPSLTHMPFSLFDNLFALRELIDNSHRSRGGSYSEPSSANTTPALSRAMSTPTVNWPLSKHSLSADSQWAAAWDNADWSDDESDATPSRQRAQHKAPSSGSTENRTAENERTKEQRLFGALYVTVTSRPATVARATADSTPQFRQLFVALGALFLSCRLRHIIGLVRFFIPPEDPPQTQPVTDIFHIWQSSPPIELAVSCRHLTVGLTPSHVGEIDHTTPLLIMRADDPTLSNTAVFPVSTETELSLFNEFVFSAPHGVHIGGSLGIPQHRTAPIAIFSKSPFRLGFAIRQPLMLGAPFPIWQVDANAADIDWEITVEQWRWIIAAFFTSNVAIDDSDTDRIFGPNDNIPTHIAAVSHPSLNKTAAIRLTTPWLRVSYDAFDRFAVSTGAVSLLYTELLFPKGYSANERMQTSRWLVRFINSENLARDSSSGQFSEANISFQFRDSAHLIGRVRDLELNLDMLIISELLSPLSKSTRSSHAVSINTAPSSHFDVIRSLLCVFSERLIRLRPLAVDMEIHSLAVTVGAVRRSTNTDSSSIEANNSATLVFPFMALQTTNEPNEKHWALTACLSAVVKCGTSQAQPVIDSTQLTIRLTDSASSSTSNVHRINVTAALNPLLVRLSPHNIAAIYDIVQSFSLSRSSAVVMTTHPQTHRNAISSQQLSSISLSCRLSTPSVSVVLGAATQSCTLFALTMTDVVHTASISTHDDTTSTANPHFLQSALQVGEMKLQRIVELAKPRECHTLLICCHDNALTHSHSAISVSAIVSNVVSVNIAIAPAYILLTRNDICDLLAIEMSTLATPASTHNANSIPQRLGGLEMVLYCKTIVIAVPTFVHQTMAMVCVQFDEATVRYNSPIALEQQFRHAAVDIYRIAAFISNAVDPSADVDASYLTTPSLPILRTLIAPFGIATVVGSALANGDISVSIKLTNPVVVSLAPQDVSSLNAARGHLAPLWEPSPTAKPRPSSQHPNKAKSNLCVSLPRFTLQLLNNNAEVWMAAHLDGISMQWNASSLPPTLITTIADVSAIDNSNASTVVLAVRRMQQTPSQMPAVHAHLTTTVSHGSHSQLTVEFAPLLLAMHHNALQTIATWLNSALVLSHSVSSNAPPMSPQHTAFHTLAAKLLFSESLLSLALPSATVFSEFQQLFVLSQATPLPPDAIAQALPWQPPITWQCTATAVGFRIAVKNVTGFPFQAPNTATNGLSLLEPADMQLHVSTLATSNTSHSVQLQISANDIQLRFGPPHAVALLSLVDSLADVTRGLQSTSLLPSERHSAVAMETNRQRVSVSHNDLRNGHFRFVAERNVRPNGGEVSFSADSQSECVWIAWRYHSPRVVTAVTTQPLLLPVAMETADGTVGSNGTLRQWRAVLRRFDEFTNGFVDVQCFVFDDAEPQVVAFLGNSAVHSSPQDAFDDAVYTAIRAGHCACEWQIAVVPYMANAATGSLPSTALAAALCIDSLGRFDMSPTMFCMAAFSQAALTVFTVDTSTSTVQGRMCSNDDDDVLTVSAEALHCKCGVWTSTLATSQSTHRTVRCTVDTNVRIDRTLFEDLSQCTFVEPFNVRVEAQYVDQRRRTVTAFRALSLHIDSEPIEISFDRQIALTIAAATQRFAAVMSQRSDECDQTVSTRWLSYYRHAVVNLTAVPFRVMTCALTPQDAQIGKFDLNNAVVVRPLERQPLVLGFTAKVYLAMDCGGETFFTETVSAIDVDTVGCYGRILSSPTTGRTAVVFVGVEHDNGDAVTTITIYGNAVVFNATAEPFDVIVRCHGNEHTLPLAAHSGRVGLVGVEGVPWGSVDITHRSGRIAHVPLFDSSSLNLLSDSPQVLTLAEYGEPVAAAPTGSQVRSVWCIAKPYAATANPSPRLFAVGLYPVATFSNKTAVTIEYKVTADSAPPNRNAAADGAVRPGEESHAVDSVDPMTAAFVWLRVQSGGRWSDTPLALNMQAIDRICNSPTAEETIVMLSITQWLAVVSEPVETACISFSGMVPSDRTTPPTVHITLRTPFEVVNATNYPIWTNKAGPTGSSVPIEVPPNPANGVALLWRPSEFSELVFGVACPLSGEHAIVWSDPVPVPYTASQKGKPAAAAAESRHTIQLREPAPSNRVHGLVVDIRCDGFATKLFLRPQYTVVNCSSVAVICTVNSASPTDTHRLAAASTPHDAQSPRDTQILKLSNWECANSPITAPHISLFSDSADLKNPPLYFTIDLSHRRTVRRHVVLCGRNGTADVITATVADSEGLRCLLLFDDDHTPVLIDNECPFALEVRGCHSLRRIDEFRMPLLIVPPNAACKYAFVDSPPEPRSLLLPEQDDGPDMAVAHDDDPLAANADTRRSTATMPDMAGVLWVAVAGCGSSANRAYFAVRRGHGTRGVISLPVGSESGILGGAVPVRVSENGPTVDIDVDIVPCGFTVVVRLRLATNGNGVVPFEIPHTNEPVATGFQNRQTTLRLEAALRIPHLSICLLDRFNAQSGMARFQEVCHASLDHLSLSVLSNDGVAIDSDEPLCARQTAAELVIGGLQIDNQFPTGYDFPVVVAPQHSSVNGGPPVFHARMVFVEPIACQRSGCLSIAPRYVQQLCIEVAPLEINAEDTYLLYLGKQLSQVVSVIMPRSSVAIDNTPATVGPMDCLCPPEFVARVTRQPTLYIGELSVSALAVNLTVHAMTPWRVFVGFDRTPLSFGEIKLCGVRCLPTRLVDAVAAKYVADAMYAAPALIGSLELLGNPTHFLRNLRAGLHDLFVLPLRGLSAGGTWGLFHGIGRGLSSVARNVGEATLVSLADVTSNLARNVQQLAGVSTPGRAEAVLRATNQSSTVGMWDGLRELGGGFAELVSQPVREYSTHGVTGLFKGMGKALVGAVAKPTVSAMTFVSTTTSHLLGQEGRYSRKRTQKNPAAPEPSLMKFRRMFGSHGRGTDPMQDALFYVQAESMDSVGVPYSCSLVVHRHTLYVVAANGAVRQSVALTNVTHIEDSLDDKRRLTIVVEEPPARWVFHLPLNRKPGFVCRLRHVMQRYRLG